MRLVALIGTLILLLSPLSFMIINTEAVDITRNFTFGFFWTSSFGDGGDSNTDTFEPDWITEENHFYEVYFGDSMNMVGAAILFLLIVGLVFAFIDTSNKKSAYILLICGIALLVLRALALDDAQTGFYESESGVTRTEIPLGFIFALIFGLIDLRKS